jgi:hypothetical protein
MSWKYAMIKVSEEIDLETNEVIGDICELVELYSDKTGEWYHFCKPSITSPEYLYMAFSDIANDGVNKWFWNNGRFTWSIKDKFWNWEKI